MAEELDKKLDSFNNELNKISDRIKDFGIVLEDNLAGKLQDSINAAKGLSEPLKDAASITKQLNTLSSANETLIVRRKAAEESYVAALKKGNKAQIETTEEKYEQLRAQLNISLALEDQVRKLQGIAEEEEIITKEKQKQNSLENSIGNALSKSFSITKNSIKEMFTLSGIFALILSKALEFNKISVELSKNLGYSGGEADRVLYNLSASSVASNNINLNSKAAAEAISQISEATGYVAEFSQDALETQILLTKQFGLTGAEAARIYELSVLTGKSSSQVNDEMVGAFVATRNQLKVGIPFKATIAAAAKVSGQLAANLQNNPALITKAVVQAAALGTTLEQTASQGEKLLDFSSSIESELKAELLTGKQLNLERARAAALAGDQVTLAQELNKNVGSLEDFQKLNVLQQKSLAEAVGLTADQLAEQLKKQQIAKETGKSIAEQNKEELLAAQKRQNLQDIFNAAVNKLSDILTVIASGPIGMLLSGLASILSNSYALYGILGAIAILKFSNITNAFKEFGGIKDKLKGLVGGGAKDKTAEAATKGAEAGTKVGGTGKAGDGIKNTLKGISSGIASFDKVSPASIAKLALSAIALTLLTPAIPGLLLLQLVNGKLIQGALTGLGQGLTAFGAAMSTGVAALGLAALVAAAVGIGYALGLAAPAIEAFGKGIAAIFDSFAKMDISQMLLIGPALASIGIGMVSLGAGAIAGSIGALIAVGIISKLAEKGDQLNVTATALQNMATALTQVSSALAGIDVSKLDALDNFASNRSSDSIVGGITDFITAPIKAVGESISGGEKGNDMAPMITAINEVRAEVAKLANRPININMDGKKVGSGLTQGSYKVA
jgi:hypothetical protein